MEIVPPYFRPTEVDERRGDPSKAARVLGWRHKTAFPDLVREMVEADLEAGRQEQDRKHRHD